MAARRFGTRLFGVLALAALGACSPGAGPIPGEKPTPPALATDRVSMPVALSNNAVAALDRYGRPYFYSFYGLSAGKSPADTVRLAYEYDVLDDRWAALPPVPAPDGVLASTAAGVDGRVYLFGGYTVDADGNETSLPHAFMFDPETRRYTRLPNLPQPVDDTVAMVYADRYVYLVSGWHQRDVVNTVQVFDTQRGEWFPATAFPGTPVFGHSGGAVGDTLMVVDGVTTRSNGAEGRRYAPVQQAWTGAINPDDPSIIQWERVPDHPGAPVYRAAGGDLSQRGWIVIAGGTANPYNYTGIGYDGRPSRPRADVYVFDLLRREWIGAGDRRVRTMDHRALVSDGDQVYTIGGMGPGRVTTGAVIPVALGPTPAG